MLTYVSIGEAMGHPAVIWHDDPYDRKLLHEEDASANPFELLVNAETLDDLMLGLEQFRFPPIDPWCTLCDDRIEDASTANDVVADIGGSPTPATLRKTNEALRVWGNPDEWADCSEYFIHVKELAAMVRDLKAVCSLYAYSVGECRFEMLKKNLSHGFYFSNSPLNPKNAEDSTLYGDYLSRLDGLAALQSYVIAKEQRKVTGGKGGDDLALWLHAANTIAFEGGMFARDAFNFFMQDAAPCILPNGKFSAVGDHGWGKVYAYFAEAFCSGKASVCDYCGKVFTRRRTTKHCCSDSCKVAKSKAGIKHDD